MFGRRVEDLAQGDRQRKFRDFKCAARFLWDGAGAPAAVHGSYGKNPCQDFEKVREHMETYVDIL